MEGEGSAAEAVEDENQVMEMVMDSGHGWTNEALEVVHDLLHDLDAGHGQEESQSWTEGIRYNAQCDGKNHYLYKMDKGAINPKTGHGYSKGRIYAGTIDKVRYKCEAYAANWESKHRCSAGRSSDGHGRPEGFANGESENDASEDPIKSVRWQDFTVSNG
jgi:hypothetical protein